MNLPSQFELFAMDFCKDLEIINQRVAKMDEGNRLNPPPLEIRPPQSPPPSHKHSFTRGRKYDGNSPNRSTDTERKGVLLSARFNNSAKIVKPKKTVTFYPRQIQ